MDVASNLYAEPLLAVVLMVKNEEHAMVKTLQPFIDAGVRSFLIFDTGSTDKTIDVTRALFEKYDIKDGFIEQEEFVDFATSRNRALMYAEDKFPYADFFLMPDAEWELVNVAGLLEFCAQHRHNSDPAYLIRMYLNSFLDVASARLIRPRRNIKFIGVVHESLDRVIESYVDDAVYFVINQTPEGYQASEKRWLRDCELLLKEHHSNPRNERTVFYLAQTYESLQQWEKACEYYALRMQMPGWDEETFIAQYKLGRCLAERGLWAEALDNYLKAYALRPTRAEPLVRIALYYLQQKQYVLSFLFAQNTLRIDYPATRDRLFIEKYLYDYLRYDVLGQAAWYVGEYVVGHDAVQKALLANFDAPHLHFNLALYLDALSTHPAES